MAAARFAYPVVLEKAPEGGFVVKFPDVPEALTQGDDKEEALTRAADAAERMPPEDCMMLRRTSRLARPRWSA